MGDWQECDLPIWYPICRARCCKVHSSWNSWIFFTDGKLPLELYAHICFEEQPCIDSVLCWLSGSIHNARPWNQVKAIFDKVQSHVCGHGSLTDMSLLLQRKNLWTEPVADHVHQLIESCVSCRATAPPQPSRKVSISSLSRNFNEIVCVDHFYFDGVQLLHCMDSATQFSAAYVVGYSAFDEAVFGFEACWVHQL